jgi:hypothetical protein
MASPLLPFMMEDTEDRAIRRRVVVLAVAVEEALLMDGDSMMDEATVAMTGDEIAA